MAKQILPKLPPNAYREQFAKHCETVRQPHGESPATSRVLPDLRLWNSGQLQIQVTLWWLLGFGDLDLDAHPWAFVGFLMATATLRKKKKTEAPPGLVEAHGHLRQLQTGLLHRLKRGMADALPAHGSPDKNPRESKVGA